MSLGFFYSFVWPHQDGERFAYHPCDGRGGAAGGGGDGLSPGWMWDDHFIFHRILPSPWMPIQPFQMTSVYQIDRLLLSVCPVITEWTRAWHVSETVIPRGSFRVYAWKNVAINSQVGLWESHFPLYSVQYISCIFFNDDDLLYSSRHVTITFWSTYLKSIPNSQYLYLIQGYE